MKKQEVSTKNYILVLIITLATVILTIALATNYKNQQMYENKNVMVLFLSEVKTDELDTFITENHDIMIYLITDNEDDEIQQKAKKIIMKNNFTKDMIVLNINVDDEVITNLKEKYFDENLKNVELKENNILFVREGKIVNILNVDLENVKTLKKYINTNFYGV